jgi:CRP-like cAMP-binding protein
MADQDDPRRNLLLARLPPGDLVLWMSDLEPVELPLGMVLHEAGTRLAHVHFPTSAVVSLVHVLLDGESAETAMVGFEGVVGIPAFTGGELTTNRAIVQSAGRAYRLRADFAATQFRQRASVSDLLLRYTQALLTQTEHTAVCNRHHSLDQQLCRWLLCSLDRQRSADITVTQELIANMLGVRREGVTHAAGQLQEAGLIRYHRGHISVIDRARLEKRACECYLSVKSEYDRLLRAPIAG